MLLELQKHLQDSLAQYLIETKIEYGELNVLVRTENIVDVLSFLKIDPKCLFISFIDVSGVDFPEKTQRFQLSYHLLSPKHNLRIRVKVTTDDKKLVPSVTSVFPGAEWYERDIYDMYGELFSGHPDLRRILTDYGFQGYPLRKDFPTTGFLECRYDNDLKKIVYEPVVLRQEVRNFDFLSPWAGYSTPDGTPYSKQEEKKVESEI